MKNNMKNIRKGLTGILFAAMMALVLAMSFPMIASADYIDTTGPTGEYYQYATFSVGDGSGYLGGGDVDSYGDYIYVNRDGTHLDVYIVSLNDTDGDGLFEPDQHLNNTNATGPMENRTLTYVRNYSVPALDTATTGEIYAASDRVYFLGEHEGDIYQYVFATGNTSKVVDSSTFPLSQLGYDDVNDVWYASRESPRTVYSWNGSGWQFEFSYVSLAGSHMDGLEVVTDPNTGIPYVYVSDMTSDYLGQWRYDSATASWVEENLFKYNGTAGDVEGLGFGALGHFWATTGFANSGTLYEIGGGELGGYVPYNPLNLTKDDGVTTCVNPGDSITYTICYDNTANPYNVSNVTITDPIPAQTSFVSATGGGTHNSATNTVTWNIGTLPAGAPTACVQLVVNVKATATPGSTIINSATINSDETPPTTVNENTAVCLPPPVISVYVDIKPGSCPNPLNKKSKGVLPVAVLGTEDFDVMTIDPSTIQLSREGIEEGVAPIRWSYEDVATPFTGELCDCHDLDGDGILDLTLKFDTQDLVEKLDLCPLDGQTIPLIITGNLKVEEGGTPIEGEDCILVLKPGKK